MREALIVTGQCIALAFYLYSPHWWATLDAAVFKEDGGHDRRHGTFHRQRLMWRVGLDLFVALVCCLPWITTTAVGAERWYNPHFWQWGAYAAGVAGLALLGLALFGALFNPLLNVARQPERPDVGPWYVSPDPSAATFPDRWLWNRAVKAFPDGAPGTLPMVMLNRFEHAAIELRWLSFWLVASGTVAYLLGMAAACQLLAQQ